MNYIYRSFNHVIKSSLILVIVVLVCVTFYLLRNGEQVTIQPAILPSGNSGEEFIVELNITKGNLNGFASVQQYLPPGFTATVIETRQSYFQNQHHLIQFTWMKLPQEKSFRISYKVKTDPSCSGLKSINGTFSYIEKEQTKKIIIPPTVITLNNQTAEAKSKDTYAGERKKEIKTNEQFTANGNHVDSRDKEVFEKKKTGSPDKKIFVSDTSTPSPSIGENSVTKKGILYKVQIAATMKQPEHKKIFFSSNYKINDRVEVEIQNGWIKYVIGSFDDYPSAREYMLGAQAKIPDAFVVAYQNGNRIPLNQALKIKH